MNDERSQLTPVAAALLAETDSSMNSARIKENGASEKTPMQTFINALPLAPPLEPPTGPAAGERPHYEARTHESA